MTAELTEIYGIETTPDLLRDLRSAPPAGIRLLRRNIETPDQVRELAGSLKSALGPTLEIAVCHEGGASTPFVRGITAFPGLEALEAAANPVLARDVGRAMGNELASMGITMNEIGGRGPMAAELALGLRCVGIKAGTGPVVPGGAREPDDEEAAALSKAVAEAAIRVERDPLGLLPVPTNAKVGLLVPRLGDVADRIPVADGLRSTAALLRPRVGAGVAVLETPVQPDPKTVGLAADWMAAQDTAIFLCFDARRFEGQRRLLQALMGRCPRLVVIPIGNPADRDLAGEQVSVLRTCGFQASQLKAALKAIFLPVALPAKRK